MCGDGHWRWGCELRVVMVFSLCTIWLLWVEETHKSTQSSRESHRAEFVVVAKMKSLEGQPVKSFHVPVSLRVTVTCTQQADMIKSYGSGLSHTLDCSYSTHCPISNVLRGLIYCHFCLSCPFQCLSFRPVTPLSPSVYFLLSHPPLWDSVLLCARSPPQSIHTEGQARGEGAVRWGETTEGWKAGQPL